LCARGQLVLLQVDQDLAGADRVARAQVVFLELVVRTVRIGSQVVGLDLEAAQVREGIRRAGAVLLVVAGRDALEGVVGSAQVQAGIRVFDADAFQVAVRAGGLFAGRVGGQQAETIPQRAAVVDRVRQAAGRAAGAEGRQVAAVEAL